MKINIIRLILTIFLFGVTAQAVTPPPGGSYPGGNTAEGQNALLSLTSGTYNTAVGLYSLLGTTEGKFNTALGAATLLANTADQNTAAGAGALLNNTTGFGNTAVGCLALLSKTTGGGNTAIGLGALLNITSGENNIALGANAGSGNAGDGSNNIYIGNGGSLDADTIRIGIQGVQTRTFIAGISGAAIVSGAAVAVDGNGQLGVALSSRRFKKEIKPMDRTSEAILALNPVTFSYKTDKTNTPQFGLIAEDVAEVNPALVVRDKDGRPYSVRYDQVNAMLLNEFLKEHRKFEKQCRETQEQKSTISQLKATVAKQEKLVAQQRNEINGLAATLREQAAQIQRVSAQVNMSRPASQQVALKFP
jgi:hypothetical protein